MSYYEYAPLPVRIFSATGINPATILLLLFIIYATVMIMLFRKAELIKQKQPQLKARRALFLIGGWIMLINIPILDKYYFDSEFKYALSRPGIFIKKQVEADGYADVKLNFGIELTDRDFKKFKGLAPVGEDHWKIADEEQCKQNGNYNYRENFAFTRDKNHSTSDGKPDELYFRKTRGSMVINNQSLRYDYVASYHGLKDGRCMHGEISKPISRYFVITEQTKRVGFGLFRIKYYIVDSWTGEEIAYAFVFQKSGNFLLRITAGLIDSNTHKTRANSNISMLNGNKLIDYNNAPTNNQLHGYMVSFTLIPSQLFQKK